MSRLYLLIPVSISALFGCTYLGPSCGDESTVSLVKSIYFDSLAEHVPDETSLAQIKDSVGIDIKKIRTVSRDLMTTKVTCEAVIEAKLPEGASRVLTYPLFKVALSQEPSTWTLEVDNRAVKNGINYTSQVTDDGNEQVITLVGHQPIAETIASLSLFGLSQPKEVQERKEDEAREAADAEVKREAAEEKRQIALAQEQKRLKEEQEREAREAAEAARAQQEPERAAQAAAAQKQLIDEYIGRIRSQIRRYTTYPPDLVGTPQAEFTVTLLPSGEVLNVRLRKSSGNPAFDNAVERGIYKAQPLPLPSDPLLFASNFREFTLFFRPEN